MAEQTLTADELKKIRKTSRSRTYIAAARMHPGIGSEALAGQLGIAGEVLDCIERGVLPGALLLKSMATILDVDPDLLLAAPPPPDRRPVHLRRPAEQQINR